MKDFASFYGVEQMSKAAVGQARDVKYNRSKSQAQPQQKLSTHMKEDPVF